VAPATRFDPRLPDWKPVKPAVPSRQPSIRRGATGLRPTFGRVSPTDAMPLCRSLDKIGPIGRTVGDTALMLDAINGYDRTYPSSIAAPFAHNSRLDRRRRGYFPADYKLNGIEELDRAALDIARRVELRLMPRKPRSALRFGCSMRARSAISAAHSRKVSASGIGVRRWGEPTRE
jgi:Amidase